MFVRNDSLLIKQKLVEIVREGSRRESPRSVKARPIGVAPSESVGANKGDNLLIIESHPVEDLIEHNESPKIVE